MVVRTKNGRPVDEADLDGLANEADAGFDLSTWRRRPGRPALVPSRVGEHSPRIEARVPEQLRVRVAQLAAEEGKSVSEVLRGLAEEYVERRTHKAHG